MQTPEEVKARLQLLYKTAPEVHISVSMARPKLCIRDDPAVIVGIFRNVFRIREQSTGIVRFHTLQYVDILTGQIRIAELEPK